MLEDEKGSITEQKTLPLNVVEAIQSAVAFKKFLAYYEVSALDVALTSRVRYMVTWNISKGHPVRKEDAEKVRKGLEALSGRPYRAQICVSEVQEENVEKRKK